MVRHSRRGLVSDWLRGLWGRRERWLLNSWGRRGWLLDFCSRSRLLDGKLQLGLRLLRRWGRGRCNGLYLWFGLGLWRWGRLLRRGFGWRRRRWWGCSTAWSSSWRRPLAADRRADQRRHLERYSESRVGCCRQSVACPSNLALRCPTRLPVIDRHFGVRWRARL